MLALFCQKLTLCWPGLGIYDLRTDYGGVEIINLKPQEHLVSLWLKIWIPDRTVMVLNLPFVQFAEPACLQQRDADTVARCARSSSPVIADTSDCRPRRRRRK